jgi:hypothetical protein
VFESRLWCAEGLSTLILGGLPRCRRAAACIATERSSLPNSAPISASASEAACQKRRRANYHRNKIATDPEYAQVVRDSRRKWRDAHPSYQAEYWRTHGDAADRNREQQRQRDRKRHVVNLVKNNAALDLKRSAAEVWLLGPAAGDLEKNNLASAQVLIFRPVASSVAAPATS